MPLDLVLQGVLALAPVVRDLVVARRAKKRAGALSRAADLPVGVGPVPPLPAEWARWFGARPEPRGAPENTILAVPGLYKMPPAFRGGLVSLCAELGIPVDSLAAIVSSESGQFNPAALNPLPAAGLIQLTLGARLPGFDTKEKIVEITTWSPEKQLELVIGPYYRRFGAKVKGASPGRLYMLNFLPAHADRPEPFVLGVQDADKAPDFDGKSTDEKKALRFSAAIYRENSGFDRAKKGQITVGDVYASIATTCASAKGRRIAVDGTLLDPPQTTVAPGKVVAQAPATPDPGPSPAPVAPAVATVRALIAGGLHAAWAKRDAMIWVPLRVGEYEIEVTAEPFSVGGIRLPVSFRQVILACKGSPYLPPTVPVCDARWQQAVRRVVLAPPGVPATTPEAEAAQVVAWNTQIGALGQTLLDGPFKEWLLHADMGPGKAVNYGFHRDLEGKLWQPEGRMHNGDHRDYSQLQWWMKRAARRNGEVVDLLDELARGCSLGGPLPAWLVGALR